MGISIIILYQMLDHWRYLSSAFYSSQSPGEEVEETNQVGTQ